MRILERKGTPLNLDDVRHRVWQLAMHLDEALFVLDGLRVRPDLVPYVSVSVRQGHRILQTDAPELFTWVQAEPCDGVTQKGTACKKPAMQTFTSCQHHVTGADKDRYEAEQEAKKIKWEKERPDREAALAKLGYPWPLESVTPGTPTLDFGAWRSYVKNREQAWMTTFIHSLEG